MPEGSAGQRVLPLPSVPTNPTGSPDNRVPRGAPVVTPIPGDAPAVVEVTAGVRYGVRVARQVVPIWSLGEGGTTPCRYGCP